MKQRQQFGRASANVLVRLAGGLAFGLPTRSGLGDGLVRTGLILTPDGNARLFSQGVRLLYRPLFSQALGSVTVTMPSLRLRWTVPVSHQVRLCCQV